MLDHQSMKSEIHLHLKVIVWHRGGAEVVLCLRASAAAKLYLHAARCE